jgi:hypothetical protein
VLAVTIDVVRKKEQLAGRPAMTMIYSRKEKGVAAESEAAASEGWDSRGTARGVLVTS